MSGFPTAETHPSPFSGISGAPLREQEHPGASGTRGAREPATLLVSVFIVSACAIFYELLISTVSSYFLGSSVLHFSITIGLFMFFMGAGSLLSKLVQHDLHRRFVEIELAIGIVGGLSAALLYLSFSLTEFYYVVAFGLIALVSLLAGMEIPIVTRIIRDYQTLKDALAHTLAFDYLGALIASVAFPLVMLPYLGLVRTAALIGLINIAVAFVCAREFAPRIISARRLQLISIVSAAGLLGLFLTSVPLTNFLERFIYEDEIVLSEQSQYQKIVLTKFKDDMRLYLNGDLQFSSIDEYRYHEPLVHVPMGLAAKRDQVLVLGAGDGLAVREILKYPDVQSVTVVDIDPAVTNLARQHPLFTELNARSFSDPRVRIVNEDAWQFIAESTAIYNVVIGDLPDPNDFALGKLYSREFYELLRKRMAHDGVLVTQSTSPFFAREAFWSIHHTLAEVFEEVTPYRAYVPSFGEWGFQLARKISVPAVGELKAPPFALRFLTNDNIASLFTLDKDTAEIEAEINTLNNQAAVRYYEQSWDQWN